MLLVVCQLRRDVIGYIKTLTRHWCVSIRLDLLPKRPVTVNNSPIQDYHHPDDHASPSYETISLSINYYLS